MWTLATFARASAAFADADFGGVCASSSSSSFETIKTTEATELTETQTLALFAGADFGGVHVHRHWWRSRVRILVPFAGADFGDVYERGLGSICGRRL